MSWNKKIIRLLNKKLEEVINADPYIDRDMHPCSLHYYARILCRYLRKRNELGRLSNEQREIILDMPVIELRHNLYYSGLSFLE